MLNALLSTHEPREGAEALPWSALVAQLQRVPGWADEVSIVGRDPTQSPHLLQLLDDLAARGVRSRLVTDGLALGQVSRVVTLRQRGLGAVALLLCGADAVEHDRVVGRPGAWAAALRALSLARDQLPTEIAWSPATPREAFGPLAALAATHGVGVRLYLSLDAKSQSLAAPDPAEEARIDAAWQVTSACGVVLHVVGGGPAIGADPCEPPVADASLVRLARDGVVPRTARGGTRSAGASEPPGDTLDLQARALLRGMGAPLLDRRVDEGGVARSATSAAPFLQALPAGSRVEVLHPGLEDRVSLEYTLPALVRALRARGMDARLHTILNPDVRPAALLPMSAPQALARVLGDAARVFLHDLPRGDVDAIRTRLGLSTRAEREGDARSSALWDTLDLSTARLVIVPDYAVARRVLKLPGLPTDARILVTDFHMLQGVDEGMADGAWPSERVYVHAAFPRYSFLYDAKRVPLERVFWRPYPLALEHFAGALPPEDCATLFCGGRHLRDASTLMEAARLLTGRVRPIEVIADPHPALHAVGPLKILPTCNLPQFVRAMARSRFLVLPLDADPTRAAGITVLSMAQALGRPVVATLTAATADHVIDGVDGLLVRPGDPAALASAIARLDGDVDLLRTLSAGARAAASRLGVERWADEIVGGATLPSAPGPDGAWRAW